MCRRYDHFSEPPEPYWELGAPKSGAQKFWVITHVSKCSCENLLFYSYQMLRKWVIAPFLMPIEKLLITSWVITHADKKTR